MSSAPPYLILISIESLHGKMRHYQLNPLVPTISEVYSLGKVRTSPLASAIAPRQPLLRCPTIRTFPGQTVHTLSILY